MPGHRALKVSSSCLMDPELSPAKSFKLLDDSFKAQCPGLDFWNRAWLGLRKRNSRKEERVMSQVLAAAEAGGPGDKAYQKALARGSNRSSERQKVTTAEKLQLLELFDEVQQQRNVRKAISSSRRHHLRTVPIVTLPDRQGLQHDKQPGQAKWQRRIAGNDTYSQSRRWQLRRLAHLTTEGAAHK